MKTINPAKNYVFAEVDTPEEKTSSGFYIPDKAKQQDNTAKIINVNMESEIDYSPDDVIIFKSYAGTERDLNGKKYILISVFDILGTEIEVQDD